MIARHGDILEAIVPLAEGIARASPDCADQATKIAELVGGSTWAASTAPPFRMPLNSNVRAATSLTCGLPARQIPC